MRVPSHVLTIVTMRPPAFRSRTRRCPFPGDTCCESWLNINRINKLYQLYFARAWSAAPCSQQHCWKVNNGI
jgi:hypothetical protein